MEDLDLAGHFVSSCIIAGAGVLTAAFTGVSIYPHDLITGMFENLGLETMSHA